jgi:glutamine synthetase type III|tara:strand:- start:195 stop:1514 length:1320 start_codon:yes stop_codon:yes gene_type:complete
MEIKMGSKLEIFAKKNKIKYFLINFLDLNGVQRSKLVPTPAIAEMEKEGAGFAGFATFLDMTPSYPDMFCLPDPEAVIQLPWKPEVAWVPGNLTMNDNLVDQAPRVILGKLIDKAKSSGYVMMGGVEPEFMLISKDGQSISDSKDIAGKPCYDQQALMRRYDVISEICDSMINLGWGTYQNDHEDANGQFEMNWDYSDLMTTADRQAFFKFMVKSIAEKHELRATFMPKPFSHLTGNGCHMHISLWNTNKSKNLFHDDKGELGLSSLGYNFLGGLIQNAIGMCAITNPTVNSYKRLNAPVTNSGATWSPNTVTYGGNNRTHMIRIPGPGRIEFRLADGAANPYLMAAAILASGLDGIENKIDPGKRLDIDMYNESEKAKNVKKLPLYLIDSIREFQKNKVLKSHLGDEFYNAYLKIKNIEWNDYSRSLTQWERDFTLDC